jgi:maltose phosphorylase
MKTVCCRKKAIQAALTLGYDQLLQDQIDAWAKIWECQTLPLMAM